MLTKPKAMAANTILFDSQVTGSYVLKLGHEGIYYLEITGGGGAGGCGSYSHNYSGNGASSSSGFKGEVKFTKGTYNLIVGKAGVPIANGEYGGNGTNSSIAGLIVCGAGLGGKSGNHRNQVRGGGALTKQSLVIIRQDVGKNGNNGGPGDKGRPGYGGASVLTNNGGGTGGNGQGTVAGAGGSGGLNTGHIGGHGAHGLIRITYLRKP